MFSKYINLKFLISVGEFSKFPTNLQEMKFKFGNSMIICDCWLLLQKRVFYDIIKNKELSSMLQLIYEMVLTNFQI